MTKRISKFIGLMITVSMVLSFVPTFVIAADAGATFNAGDYTYKINTDTSTVTLTAIATAKLTGEVTVPGTVSDGEDTYTVTHLGDAFKNQGTKTAEITSIILPDTITKFTGTATFFNCSGLTSIQLPVNLTGDATATQLSKTFYGCTSLTTVELPAGIKKCWGTFANGSGVRTVIITGTAAVDFYGGSGTAEARAWDDGTTGITIYYPANGTAPKRASDSFTATVKKSDPLEYSINAEDTTTVTIIGVKDNITSIGENLTLPETVEIDGSTYTVTGIGDEAFSGREEIASVTIPDTVNSIGERAFAYCTSLATIEIPDGVSELDQTFLGCISLKTVTIPATVTTITDETFYTDLESNGGEPIPRLLIYCVENSAAENYAIENSIAYEAESVIPEAWDGLVDTSWYDAGEFEYYISTAAELAGVRKLVNDGTELFYNKTITLTDNINMEGTVWKVGIGYNVGSESEERCFNGVFDGDGHRIYNFNYDSNADADSVSDITIPAPESHTKHGLFGELGRYGKVMNLGLENASVTAGSTDNKVTIYVGSIAGVNNGEINHCYINGLELNGGYWGAWCNHSYGGTCGVNAGTVEDVFIKDVDFTGIVAQLNSSRKGGITSTNSGTIKDCYVLNPIYSTSNGYYQWDENGAGTSTCPIMFYYDPISTSNSGTISNVYSSDSFTRNGWTTGVHPYDTFSEMTDKMELSMDKLTFRTIAHAEMEIDIQKVDGNLTGISPEVYIEFTQASNVASITDETIILKQGDNVIDSFEITYQDDVDYPYQCTLKFEDDLAWDTEYEISAIGVKDLWNREIAAATILFKTTNEIVCQEFALYENYGEPSERRITSLANVSGPVTAVITGLKNNGDNSYNAVFSVSAISDGQILKGAAKLISIAANETKSSPVVVGNIDISAISRTDIEMQAVLYKAFENVVPLIKSVQASK